MKSWRRRGLILASLLVVVFAVRGLLPHSDSSFAGYFDELKRNSNWDKLHTLLKAMPKGGELHSHLSGAVPVDRLLRIAEAHNYTVKLTSDDSPPYMFVLPGRKDKLDKLCAKRNMVCKPVAKLEPEERFNLERALTLDLNDQQRDENTEFAEFGLIFDRLDELTDNADVMPALVQAVMVAASENNVSYLELKLNPIKRTDSKDEEVRIEDLVARLMTAVEQKNRQLGNGRTVMVKFIVAISRRSPHKEGGHTDLQKISCDGKCPSRLRQAYYLAAMRHAGSVVGIDIMGLPEKEVDGFNEVFNSYKKEFGEANITLHAGETTDPKWKDHIPKAIAAGAKRLGHAFNLRETSQDALALVCRGDIPLEISLTSNLRLGFLPGDDMDLHPFSLYFRAEVCVSPNTPSGRYLPVILNTDDAGVFETDLSNEFSLAVKHFDLTWDELKQLCRNSLKHAFATEKEKQELLSRWEVEIKRFEKNWLDPS